MVATPESALDRDDVANLLSELIGEPIAGQKIPKLWTFLAALSAILVGVTYADSQVTDAEKHRLRKILEQFMPSDSKLIQVTKLLIKGVQQAKLYRNLEALGKLTNSLSESERLLLCAFGYEIATADGSIDLEERKYLHRISDLLQITAQLSTALEESLTRQPVRELSAVAEIKYLLAPSRFQVLDPVFANAAAQMLENLPHFSQAHAVADSSRLKFEALAQDQAQRHHIEKCCNQLTELLNGTQDKAFTQAVTEISQLAEKARSQTFRVAVVGEFSQGKSTLLNALLGEEIQPTRAIPCSGTITVLRYGDQKRVICRYRDGSEAEIPIQDYETKAAISMEAALNHRDAALSNSAIEEIIYEHPGLELCRSGVEVIDSPGLNEHPERTRITQKLLQNVDAVIFLINAARPLTQSERELMTSLKTQLSRNPDQPAENLFVLVNFMDLLRKEQDRQQVRQLVENFVYGNALIPSKNRLFFVSAQAALDAILAGEQSQYLEVLQQFMQGLEQFLTIEKGEIRNRQSRNALDRIAEQVSAELTQIQKNIALSVAARQEVLEKLGEASGYFGQLQQQIQDAIDAKLPEVRSRASTLLKRHLEQRIAEKAKAWSSEQTEKSKILKEFSEKFQIDSQAIVEEWVEEIIIEKTLSTSLKSINTNLVEMIRNFQKDAASIDQATGSLLVRQLNLSVKQVSPEFQLDFSTNDDDFFDTLFRSGIGGGIGLGTGGILAGGAAFAVTSIAFFPVVLTGAAIAGIAVGGAALGTAIGGVLGFFTPHDKDALREEALQKGFEQIAAQNIEIQWINAIESLTRNLFNEKLKFAQEVTDQYVALLNSLLVRSEVSHALTVEEAKEKAQIYAKYLAEVEAFRSQISAL